MPQEIQINLKKVKISNLGRGQITCITAEDTLEIIKNEIVIQPNFLITGDIEWMIYLWFNEINSTISPQVFLQKNIATLFPPTFRNSISVVK